MKKILAVLISVVSLTGCVVANPYYVAPASVYYNPAPVYYNPPRIYYNPAPVYYNPPRIYYRPQCYMVPKWNNYNRNYQNVRVCR
jgi:hypothetical protein